MALLTYDIQGHTILHKIVIIFLLEHTSVFCFARYVKKQGEKSVLFNFEKCVLKNINNSTIKVFKSCLVSHFFPETFIFQLEKKKDYNKE